MKIMLLQDAEWRKKGPHQQHHLMELLSLNGHEILVIGFDQLWKEEPEGLYSRRVEIESISRFYKGARVNFIRPWFIRMPLLDYISFLYSSRAEINCQIDRFCPEVIIGFSSILSNYWGLIASKRFDIPYLYYCYDNPSALLVPKPFVLLAEKIVCYIMRESNKVLTINNALNDYVIRLGANAETTEVLPQGVDTKRFEVPDAVRQSIRAKYNIGKDDLVLFFMGWLYPFLGLRDIITDIYKYKNNHNRIKLMIVGYGPEFANLTDLVSHYNLQDCIILTGKKNYEEIPELISAADICLQPAYDDPVIRDIAPIKLYEYLAMSKPVISTRLPGVMKEFGTDNGIIYVEEPKEILSMALSLSVEDINENKLKANKFIKDYDWDKIVSNFEYVLESLQSDASRARPLEIIAGA